MAKPATTIPTPAKYRLQRTAARGLPILFFAVVCGLSGLLWKHQSRSEVLVGEVEVVEYSVASPDVGTVSQLVPSEGQELDTYVAVAKDQLLVQLDDAPVRSRLDSIERELLTVSDEVTNELARLNMGRKTTRIVSVTDEEIDTETEEAESEESTDSTEAVETEAPVEEEATESDDPAETLVETVATDEIEEVTPENEPVDDESVGVESDVWVATQSLVDQSLAAVDVARRELDLRQLDTELLNAKSEIIATGGDLETLESFRQERRAANNAIFEMKSELQTDRVSAFAEIPQDNLSATSRLVFRSLQNRVKAAETQLASVQTSVGRLDVSSPVDGQIEQSHVQLRQAVTPGQPLLTIVPQRGTMVVVYVREQSLFRPFSGMPVTLRSRVNVNQQVDAVVEAVGPKVEEIPERHRLNPKVVEWGRPMRIRVPEKWLVEPGSLLDVILN